MTKANPAHHVSKSNDLGAWDADGVCRTLLFWYPDLLGAANLHSDMCDRRKAMEFVACLQEYPANLQDLLILLAQRSGIREATLALDNAIRKELAKPRRSLKVRGAAPASDYSSKALTAQAS